MFVFIRYLVISVVNKQYKTKQIILLGPEEKKKVCFTSHVQGIRSLYVEFPLYINICLSFEGKPIHVHVFSTVDRQRNTCTRNTSVISCKETNYVKNQKYMILRISTICCVVSFFAVLQGYKENQNTSLFNCRISTS